MREPLKSCIHQTLCHKLFDIRYTRNTDPQTKSYEKKYSCLYKHTMSVTVSFLVSYPEDKKLRWKDRIKEWTTLILPGNHVLTKDREAWQKLVREINGASTTNNG